MAPEDARPWSCNADPPKEADRPLVLLVDGNRDLLSILSALLEEAGFRALTSMNAQEAIRSFLTHKPDAVVMELRLSGGDTFELCKKMRRSGGAKPFVVAYTGYGSARIAQQARSAGFDELVVKPGHPEQLVNLLQRSLQQR